MKKGFTLLEMVIVVFIVSLLFLLTIPNIQTTLGIVSDKGCSALTKVVDSAIMQYRLEYDENPGSTADLINAGLLNEEQVTCNDKTIAIVNGQAAVQ